MVVQESVGLRARLVAPSDGAERNDPFRVTLRCENALRELGGVTL